MKHVLVIAASIVVLAGILAPSAAAGTPARSSALNAAVGKATKDVNLAASEIVKCISAVATTPSIAGVLRCVRTALVAARASINRAIDAIEASTGAPSPAVKAAFTRARAALAAAFQRVDDTLAAAGG